MSVPSNTYQTYNASNNIFEDISDVIYQVDRKDTPLFSMLPKKSATNTYHEWQTETLRSPAVNGTAVIEGDDTTARAVTAPNRLGNYTEIFKGAIQVSGTHEAVDRIGIKGSVLAREVVREGTALKRDIEATLFSNRARAAGSDGVGRKLAGLPSWLTSNVSRNGAGATSPDGANPTGDGSDTATNAGDTRAFTEGLLMTVMQSAYTNGGRPDKVFMAPVHMTTAASFTGNATKFDRTEDRKIYNVVKVYETPFGELDFIPDAQLTAATGGTRNVFLIDTDYAYIAQLRAMRREKLAKTGDSEREQILAELTLSVTNERAHGIVADLTAS